MAEPKTRPTDADVGEFLAAIPHAGRRADATVVDAMMRAATGEDPVVWGTSIVGYGQLDQAGSGGAMRSWPVVAFSPRKAELVLYLDTELDEALVAAIGPHRRGVGCVYLKRLDAIDEGALRDLIRHSVETARRRAAEA